MRLLSEGLELHCARRRRVARCDEIGLIGGGRRRIDRALSWTIDWPFCAWICEF